MEDITVSATIIQFPAQQRRQPQEKEHDNLHISLEWATTHKPFTSGSNEGATHSTACVCWPGSHTCGALAKLGHILKKAKEHTQFLTFKLTLTHTAAPQERWWNHCFSRHKCSINLMKSERVAKISSHQTYFDEGKKETCNQWLQGPRSRASGRPSIHSEEREQREGREPAQSLANLSPWHLPAQVTH